ncbi:MAG: PspA/IM30 family protein [Pirellulaceae bacterium]
MFKAVGKYFRAVWYLMTFRVDKASETLRMNPGVISANYDRVIEEKRSRLNQYKDAVSSMIAQEETKKDKLKQLTSEIEKLEKLKAGAAGKAKKLVEKYNGDINAVKGDPEYVKCQSAFKDFSSTLSEKQQRANELDDDLKGLVANVTGHKTQIQALLRELEKLKEEKHDAVADVLSATEEKEIADMMTGLSNDRTSEELRELREMRSKANANARISRELAGMDNSRAEAEFLEYAQTSDADDEFDALIGLSESESPATEQNQQDAQIPEG